ncbi:MAG TPA: sigma-70 family RNA polymerase sigma factor [Saprospiraceae bacterium]|nr:sigma-70 family RNA polymerase sigma factor [Saprospiraceae bacterium]
MTNTAYIQGIVSGDAKVLRHMYQTIYPGILRMVLQQGGLEADARDVFQEATIVLYNQALRADFSIQHQFTTYFTAVCRNIWFNRQTKKSASNVTIGEEAKLLTDEGQVELDFVALERQELFDTAFLKLGEDCQKLLTLFFEKVAMSEIAKIMGYASEGYARRRKFQCKDYLMEQIKSLPKYLELIQK